MLFARNRLHTTLVKHRFAGRALLSRHYVQPSHTPVEKILLDTIKVPVTFCVLDLFV
jgi:hypothetical protein